VRVGFVEVGVGIVFGQVAFGKEREVEMTVVGKDHVIGDLGMALVVGWKGIVGVRFVVVGVVAAAAVVVTDAVAVVGFVVVIVVVVAAAAAEVVVEGKSRAES
jgi:hypothetical protein